MMKISKTEKFLVYKAVKGVFSKPSGKYKVAPFFLFFELETSRFGYLFIS